MERANDLPGAIVENGGEIKPTFSRMGIGKVGEPDSGIGFCAVELRASLLGLIG